MRITCIMQCTLSKITRIKGASEKKHLKSRKENKLSFAPRAAEIYLEFGAEFKSIVSRTSKKLESKWSKLSSAVKRHAQIFLSMAIIGGVSRCITGTRTKINGQCFYLKTEKTSNASCHPFDCLS